MRDIRYKWNEGPNSVGVSSEVSLPQFKVLGHRQRAMEISLTTGTCRRCIRILFSYSILLLIKMIQQIFSFQYLTTLIPPFSILHFPQPET